MPLDNTAWSRKTSEWITTVAGSFAVLGGAATLSGWFTGVTRLIDWTGSGITMKVNAAAAVAAAGLALVIETRFGGSTRTRAVVCVLSGLTALIGALTLGQHLSGWDLGIDNLLVPDIYNQRASAAPGRVGIPAATSFLLLGTGILFSFIRRTRRYSVIAGLLALTLSLLSLFGYVFGAATAYTLPRLTGIAFQTALIILTLGIGVVASVPEHEPMRTLLSDSAAGVLVRRVLPWIVVVPLVLGWLRVNGQEIGLFDLRFGTAARTLVEVILLAVLLWRSAAAIKAYEKRLREEDRRKDEFLAILAHELRNPIAAIRNNLNLMSIDGTDLGKTVEVLDRQSGQLARLVDDLLDVSRIANGKIELRKEVVELGPIVEQAAAAVTAMYDDDGIELTVDVQEEPIYVDADSARVAQVICFKKLLTVGKSFGLTVAANVQRLLARKQLRTASDSIKFPPLAYPNAAPQ